MVPVLYGEKLVSHGLGNGAGNLFGVGCPYGYISIQPGYFMPSGLPECQQEDATNIYP